MNIAMRNNTYFKFYAVFLAYVLLSFVFPQFSLSAQLYHTISISSFSKIAPAEKQYEALIRELQEQDLDHLRIEKIGKFYCVRLGKFDDKSSADEFFAAFKGKLPGAAVMSAYIKDERIVKIYSGASSVESAGKEAEPEPVPEINQVKQDDAQKAAQPTEPESLEEKLAAVPALMHNNNFGTALDLLKSEIELHPEHPELNAWIGMVYLKMDRSSDALQYLEKAARLSPGIPEYHNSFGYSLLFLEKYDQAISEFNNAIRLDPGYFDSLTGLCMSYAKKGDKAEALKIYNKIREHDKTASDRLLKIIEQ